MQTVSSAPAMYLLIEEPVVMCCFKGLRALLGDSLVEGFFNIHHRCGQNFSKILEANTKEKSPSSN